MDDHHSERLAKSILILADAIDESTVQRKHELDCFRSSSLATKHDLKELGEKIMSLLKDLGAQLATVDDALDKILAEIKDLEKNLENMQLPADAQTNLDRLTGIVTAIQNVLTPPTTDVVTLDTIPNQNMGVSQSTTVPLTGIGSSVNGASLTASASASDTTVIPSVSVSLDAASTGTLSLSSGVAGTATVTVTVSDGIAQAQKVFTVTVA